MEIDSITGIRNIPYELYDLCEPIDSFSLLFTNDLINGIVAETNLYATQQIEKMQNISKFSRITR